jgi:hypothetical protein
VASKIYGPAGDPGAPPGTQQITLVPYHELEHDADETKVDTGGNIGPMLSRSNYAFNDGNAVLSQGTANVFADGDDLGWDRSGTTGRASGANTPALNSSLRNRQAPPRAARGTPPLQQPRALWAPANEEIETVPPPPPRPTQH